MPRKYDSRVGKNWPPTKRPPSLSRAYTYIDYMSIGYHTSTSDIAKYISGCKLSSKTGLVSFS